MEENRWRLRSSNPAGFEARSAPSPPAAFGFGLVIALRAISDLPLYQTEQTGYPHVVVPLILAPLGFLAGFGCFDYWLRWAAGLPTIPDDHSQHGAKSWKDYFRFNTDHKVIGIQYICTTFFFFFVGGLMAMLIRAELAQPGTQIVDAATYNSLFSTHAVLMIFVFVIPVFAGIANYVLPLMIGAPDMAFPRLNALSFWMLPLAGILFIGSFLAPGGAFDAGWTGYAPLSTGAPLGQSFFNLGVQFAGASSIATALNFLVTIITMRAPGMTFWRMPLLVWANLSTSLLVVAATPFIAGAQFMVLFDRILHTNFFQFAAGGDVISYQHIFWFYSHPAVYIMMLPGFGIISEVISTHCPQADLRLPADGPGADRDRRPQLLGLGPPHVRRRHVQLAAGADDADHAADRGADRDQDLLLAGHALLRQDPHLLDGDAVRARLHRHLHDRRHQRRHARHGADRHPRLRHLLHRRPHPLRPLRRLGLHDLRRDLPLVPEDDRADVRRETRPRPLLGHPGRHLGHLHPDALGRHGRDAATRRRLRRPSSATGTC